MYVCLCNAVTEKDIDAAIDDGARAVADLRERLLVATCCGACEETAAAYLSANLGQRVTCRSSNARPRRASATDALVA